MLSANATSPDALTSAAALRSMTSYAWVAQAMRVAAKLGIADLLAVASKWPSARLGTIEVRPIEEELRQERPCG